MGVPLPLITPDFFKSTTIRGLIKCDHATNCKYSGYSVNCGDQRGYEICSPLGLRVKPNGDGIERKFVDL